MAFYVSSFKLLIKLTKVLQYISFRSMGNNSAKQMPNPLCNVVLFICRKEIPLQFSFIIVTLLMVLNKPFKVFCLRRLQQHHDCVILLDQNEFSKYVI